jgi:hypothetical protein
MEFLLIMEFETSRWGDFIVLLYMTSGAHLPIAALRGYAVYKFHNMKIDEEIPNYVSGNTGDLQ